MSIIQYRKEKNAYDVPKILVYMLLLGHCVSTDIIVLHYGAQI